MSANIMSIIAPLLVGFILKDPVSTELQLMSLFEIPFSE